MQPCVNPSWESNFMEENLSRLLDRFSLSYKREDNCIEYYLHNARSRALISYSLVFSYNHFSRKIHVAKFHPELIHQGNAKYLSAACFYLLVHHTGQTFSYHKPCEICLDTREDIFHDFYEKLIDFKFSISGSRTRNNVALRGDYTPYDIDTAFIRSNNAWQ